MIEIVYFSGIPIALLVITIMKAREFGFISIGGMSENIFLSLMWPATAFAAAIAAILTCEFRIWRK